MTERDTTVLFKSNDRVTAEQAQEYLEGKGIYTVLRTDHPASSVMGAYMGSTPLEMVTIKVTLEDEKKAIETLKESPFSHLIERMPEGE